MFVLGMITGAALCYGALWLAARAIEQGWWR